MPHLNDLAYDSLVNTWSEVGLSGSDAALTVTKAAVAARRHAIQKADASYEISTKSGELTVRFGTAIVGRKFIHGAGAIDFGSMGRIAAANEEVSATLEASTGGTTSTITLSGYTTDGSIT